MFVGHNGRTDQASVLHRGIVGISPALKIEGFP